MSDAAVELFFSVYKRPKLRAQRLEKVQYPTKREITIIVSCVITKYSSYAKARLVSNVQRPYNLQKKSTVFPKK